MNIAVHANYAMMTPLLLFAQLYKNADFVRRRKKSGRRRPLRLIACVSKYSFFSSFFRPSTATIYELGGLALDERAVDAAVCKVDEAMDPLQTSIRRIHLALGLPDWTNLKSIYAIIPTRRKEKLRLKDRIGAKQNVTLK
jgi:hypothetical protein